MVGEHLGRYLHGERENEREREGNHEKVTVNRLIKGDVLGEPNNEKYCGQNQRETGALKEVGADAVYGFALGNKARVNEHGHYVLGAAGEQIRLYKGRCHGRNCSDKVGELVFGKDGHAEKHEKERDEARAVEVRHADKQEAGEDEGFYRVQGILLAHAPGVFAEEERENAFAEILGIHDVDAKSSDVRDVKQNDEKYK